MASVPSSTQTLGAWQGRTYPLHVGPRTPPDRFLVLDTGGTGGGFGQGDIRQKLHDVSFWNDKLGWTCGYGGAFRTTDGGFTWTRMRPNGGWYHVEMSGPEEVWLLEAQHPGGPGKVWLRHTTDGGANWEEVLPGKLAGYSDLYCRGPERWVLCGGFLSFRSRDGETTWVPVLGGSKHIDAFFGFSASRLWGVGDVPGFVPNDLVLIRRTPSPRRALAVPTP
ncbi:MAG: hypothetical protein GW892_13715 [Armatimonadetes bacterium]|nr:hypothetical protein [Armatimonadota bacterium]PIU93072.1 MAG: hypothetical protein COS65_14600 [Armatimonadetes bacterium CG06_land_8_20_14_3_00_66_21]PIX37567.1 MAG: hypothetical protein COZ57_33725 [Armatimonadetes bacterium CG_4_8_14_3_um_filter_66_20]